MATAGITRNVFDFVHAGVKPLKLLAVFLIHLPALRKYRPFLTRVEGLLNRSGDLFKPISTITESVAVITGNVKTINDTAQRVVAGDNAEDTSEAEIAQWWIQIVLPLLLLLYELFSVYVFVTIADLTADLRDKYDRQNGGFDSEQRRAGKKICSYGLAIGRFLNPPLLFKLLIYFSLR